jgi:hypothetical protein
METDVMKIVQEMNYSRRLRNLGLLLPLLVVVLLASCEKEPGEGGLATIQGRVWGRDINVAGVVHDSGWAGGFKVYLSYGDNTWVDETETTSPTGDYAFQGLQKGTYRLYMYSECDSCLFNQVYVEQSAEITGTRQVAVLPDFIVYK